MPNMSYCRFENTYGDLSDCEDNISSLNESNITEVLYRKKLIQMCKDIAEKYDYLLENDG